MNRRIFWKEAKAAISISFSMLIYQKSHMGWVNATNTVKGDIGELYFEHYSQQGANKYAYIRLEDIYRSFTPQGKLWFKLGWYRVQVLVPEEIHEEIRKVCKPTNFTDDRPSFVFDYLTVSLFSFEYNKSQDIWELKPGAKLTPKAFTWVEVKTGNSPLSESQEKMKNKVKLPFYLFRVKISVPEKVEVVTEH